MDGATVKKTIGDSNLRRNTGINLLSYMVIKPTRQSYNHVMNICHGSLVTLLSAKWRLS